MRREHGGDADAQVGQPGLAAGDRGERVGEGRVPGHHLQDELRQVHLGQHRLQPVPQVGQAGGVRHGLDVGDVQLPVGVHPHVGVDDQPPGDLPVGRVQAAGVRGQQGVRALRQAERGQRRAPGPLPDLAVQELGARGAPARRGLGVDVTSAQVPVELLQHAEHVRGPVRRFL